MWCSSLLGVGRSARHKAIALGRVARSPGGSENFGGSRCVAFRVPEGQKSKIAWNWLFGTGLYFPVAVLSILFGLFGLATYLVVLSSWVWRHWFDHCLVVLKCKTSLILCPDIAILSMFSDSQLQVQKRPRLIRTVRLRYIWRPWTVRWKWCVSWWNRAMTKMCWAIWVRHLCTSRQSVDTWRLGELCWIFETGNDAAFVGGHNGSDGMHA